MTNHMALMFCRICEVNNLFCVGWIFDMMWYLVVKSPSMTDLFKQFRELHMSQI